MEKNRVLIFNWLYDTKLGNQQAPPGWHSELAESLVSGDPQIADAAMRRHTRFRTEDVLERMAPYFEESQSRLGYFLSGPAGNG